MVSFETGDIGHLHTGVCVGVQQEKIEEPGPSRGVKVVSRSLPHSDGVHSGFPEGPAHGTNDRISSSSGRVAPGESTLAGCPQGLHCEHGYSARFGGTSHKGGCCRRHPPRTVEVCHLLGRFMCGLHDLVLVR